MPIWNSLDSNSFQLSKTRMLHATITNRFCEGVSFTLEDLSYRSPLLITFRDGLTLEQALDLLPDNVDSTVMIFEDL